LYGFMMLTSQHESLLARSYMTFSLPIYTTGTDYKIQISAKKRDTKQTRHDKKASDILYWVGGFYCNCALTISLAHRAVSLVDDRYPAWDRACFKHSEIHSCWKYSRNSPPGNASATSLLLEKILEKVPDDADHGFECVFRFVGITVQSSKEPKQTLHVRSKCPSYNKYNFIGKGYLSPHLSIRELYRNTPQEYLRSNCRYSRAFQIHFDPGYRSPVSQPAEEVA